MVRRDAAKHAEPAEEGPVWRLVPLLAALVGLLALAGLTAARESVLAFDADVVIHADGSMTVTETIRVRSEGWQIRHGIFRDLPAVHTSLLGVRETVPLHILGVTRDGERERYQTATSGRHLRVTVGTMFVPLPLGDHTYVIRYRTDGQLAFHGEHDELYWNVTGNGWTLPIDAASARVHLPQPADDDAAALEAFVGYAGSREPSADVARHDEGGFVLRATRPLEPGEGFTVVVGWPKGAVREPTRAERAAAFERDNPGILAARPGALGVTAYFAIVGLLCLRRPRRAGGVAVEQPPEGLSPAALRYVRRMGFDMRVLCAAITSLAVKGLVEVDRRGATYLVRRMHEPGSDAVQGLPDEERHVLMALGASLHVTPENHEYVQSAAEGVQRILRERFEPHAFVVLRVAWSIGLVATAAALGWAAVASGSIQTIASIGMVLSVTACVTLLRRYRHAENGEHLFSVGASGLFGLAFAYHTFTAGLLWFALYAAALGAICILAHAHLRIPTRHGRALMHEIDAFAAHLASDPRDMGAGSDGAHLTFERYLPHALALDVDDAWIRAFEARLHGGVAGGVPYAPVWFHNRRLGIEPQELRQALGASFSSALQSASFGPIAARGGGRFAGGGRGGGGGGGW